MVDAEPDGSKGDPAADLDAIGRTCFALHSRMTARLLSRVYDAALRPSGLKVTQFSVLGTIGYGATTSEVLAERLGLERTTLVRNLKLLADSGWIEAAPGDGRGIRHKLTEAGRAKLASAIPLWKSAQRTVEGKLAGIDADGARQALRALRKASR